ncbi:listerin E3 ubiquitin protein ligase 1 [Geranomyces variabilis]|uniref:E3 ubiquitin-protein ligase listerin n=1 Tax=Geranomyces variabilis TaxID=109894 RepID=A0AAD5TIE3_9FUNG|nr:listerin E3 ubiquitin protein ligase 1 [Geranomyces variabilis]
MGREKDRRVKGNLQPAASSRAADLLANGSAAFGFPTGSEAPAFGASSDWELNNAAPEVKVLFKRLAKRDNTTRVKALEELSAYISEADAESVSSLLPAWPKTYNRLSADADRRVRETTGAVHLALVNKVRKQLAPHLKDVIGPWLCATHDPYKEVSRLASTAFKTAFPSKHADVMAFCQAEILQFIVDNLLVQTPETMSDPRFTSPEDMKSRYARVVSSSMVMLASLIQLLPTETLAKEASTYELLYDDLKFWKLSYHDLAPIRKAFYVFLKAAALGQPVILSCRLESVSAVFPGRSFSEKETANHGAMWESLLIFTKAFPESWLLAAKRKPVLPKFYSFLQNGGNGSAAITFPSLLPLIAHFPGEILLSSQFHQDFLANLWAAVESGAGDSSVIMVESYLECIFFLLLQCRAGGLDAQERHLVEVDLLRAARAVLMPPKVGGMAANVSPSIAPSEWGSRQTPSPPLLDALCKYIVKISSSPEIGENAVRILSAGLSDIFENALGLGESPILDTAVAQQLSSTAPDLLASLYKLAGGHNVPGTVQLSFKALIIETYAKAMSGMNENGRIIIAALFARKLSEALPSTIFADTATQEIMMDFASSKIIELSKIEHKAVPHLLDIVVMYASQLGPGEHDRFQKCWTRLLQVLFSLEGPERVATLHSVLKEAHQVHVKHSFSLCDSQLDSYVFTLFSEILGKPDDDMTSDVEEILAISLMCSDEQPLLTPATRLSITSGIASLMADFTREYLYNDTGREQDATELVGSQETVRKIASFCRVIDRVLAKCPDQLELFASVSYEILAISSVTPLDKADGLYPLDGLERDLLSLREASKHAWSRACFVVAHEATGLSSLATRLYGSWEASLCDLSYCAGIESLGAQFEALFALCAENDGAISVPMLERFFHNQSFWRQHSASYDLETPMLAILNPRLAPVASDSIANSVDIPKDSHGLSFYARIVIITARFESQHGFTILSSAGDYGWVLVELLRAVELLDRAEKLGQEPLFGPDSRGLGNEIKRMIHSDLAAAVDLTPSSREPDWHLSLANNVKRILQDTSPSTPASDGLSSAIIYALTSATLWGSDYSAVVEKVFASIFRTGDVTSACAKAWIPLALEVPARAAAPVTSLFTQSMLRSAGLEARKPVALQLASRIIGHGSDETTASESIALLNAILGLYEESTPFGEEPSLASLLPAKTAVDLIRRIRGWYEQNGAIKAASGDRYRLDKEIGILLAGVLRQIDVGINLGGFVVNLCKYWIHATESALADARNEVVLYTALRLYKAVLAAQRAYPDAYKTLEEQKADMQIDVLNQFIAHGDLEDMQRLSQPQARLLNLLGELADGTPEAVLLRRDPFAELLRMLGLPTADVQIVAYGLLRRLIGEHVQAASLRVEMKATEAAESEDTAVEVVKVPSSDDQLPAALVTALMRDVPIWDTEEIEFPSSLTSSTRNGVLGCFLSALAMLDHITDATFELRASYVTHIRNLEVLPGLLDLAFVILGVGQSRSTPFDLARWDIDHYDVTGFDVENDVAFSLLAAHIYWRCLRTLPSLVRIWWSECKNRQLTIAVESYTERFFSPLLIRTEVDIVQKADLSAAAEDLAVKVSKSGNEVSAAYTVEDAVLEMVIRLPATFPLRQVDVDSGGSGAAAAGGRAAGISEARWRAWLLSASAVIASQNGSIADAVKLYGKNIALHFKGVEDCAICYSVIGVIDRTLPTKQCKTCKHKFHASCLFKPEVYTHVINEVCDAMSATFAETGVGQNVLAELRQVWKQKISHARIAEFEFVEEYEGQYQPYDDGGNGAFYPADGVDQSASFAAAANLVALAAASATTAGLGRLPQEDGAGDDEVLDPASSAPADPGLSQRDIDALVHKLWMKKRAAEAQGLAAHRKSKRIGQHDGVDDDDDEDDDDDNDDGGINSDLDDDDSEDDSYDPQHLILCQYEKVNRVKNKWKCALKDGIITVNGRDYVFNKANGEFEW